jgi:AraC-like DNA-binding protein
MLKRDDDPRYTQATIPPLILAGLMDYAHGKGFSPERWLVGTGLTPEQLQQSQTLVSFRQASTVVRRALRELPNDALGLLYGSREGVVSFGMLGFAMMSCRNLGEAFEIGIQYHQASGSLMDVVAEVMPTEVALRVYERFPEPELLPFFCEEVFSSSLALVRSILGHSTAPKRIELSYPPPPYEAVYRRLFNCPVHFNSDANRLVLDAALLDKPLATYSPASFSIALAACRQLIEPLTVAQPDLIASIESLLRDNARQRLSMAEVARRLNLTERTLRRNLAEAHDSFSAIRDRVLEKRARILLGDSRLTITAISEELGFSDLREFRRAFQRWTGLSPMSVRRQSAGLSTDHTPLKS